MITINNINNNAVSDKNSKSKSQRSYSHKQNQTINNSNNIKQKRPLLVKEHTSASILSSSKSTNIVGSHYRLIRKIGEGSFGVIFEGINLLNNQPVAVKFESRTAESPQLKDEYRSYKLLNGSVGVPNVYYYGTENSHNILVIDLLGPSLEDLFDVCGRQFSVKTVAMVAKQMINRIQTVHESSLVYRDIKPDNFLVGHIINDNKQIIQSHSKTNPHPATQIYIVDFGMAKYYRDPTTLQHIPYKEKRSLSGTARYMSIHTHLGHEQSRRDDLESLGHVFMYFLRGSLPWQGLRAPTNKQKYKKIGEKKRSTSISELCMGFPEEFSIYMNYVRKLAFEETPDYDYLRGLMDNVLKNMDCEDDGLYDWVYVIDKRRKEKEQRRNDLIYPQNATSKPNLFNGKIQQVQHSLHYHSNYNSQEIQKSQQNDYKTSKINEMSYHSIKQPTPMHMQLQNNALRNSTNIYNPKNSKKYSNYRQLELLKSKSYEKYNKYDDNNNNNNNNNMRYNTDKEEYSKLMISDIDIRSDQKHSKHDYNTDNIKNNKNKLINKNTEETENTSCFKHMFLCCFK